jgi:hypothetical protein
LIELDVQDGLGVFELVAEDPLLGGSVPQRAAQGCAPLLEGHSLGLQLRLKRPIVVRKSLTGLGVDAAFIAKCRVMAPALVARGLLTAEEGAVAAKGLVSKRGRARLFTGLFVQSPPGLRVVLRAPSARASRALWVHPHRIEACELHARSTPIFLEFDLRKGLHEARVDGVVATLMLAPGSAPELVESTLEERLELLRAHAAFYDQAYFEAKKQGKVTKKYKRLRDKGDVAEPSMRSSISVAQFGPRLIEREGEEIVVRAPFDFRARYDGSLVHVEADDRARAEFAREVEAELSPALQLLGHEHPGARLYFSKFFTPHPAGEPHFFVKPPALLRTLPGYSTLVEGRTYAFCRTMRGLVRTDVFGAVPLVFEVFTPFEEIEFRAGDVLGSLWPMPRTLTKVAAKISSAGL